MRQRLYRGTEQLSQVGFKDRSRGEVGNQIMFNCFHCKQEIVFDAEHIGKNGKKIPLDPTTHAPHDCPMRDKPTSKSFDEAAKELKDDHGNEDTNPKLLTESPRFVDPEPKPISPKEYVEKLGYVNHTAKGASKVKIFSDEDPDVVEDEYNTFLIHATDGKIKVQGAQFHIAESYFAIALYYEEVINQ